MKPNALAEIASAAAMLLLLAGCGSDETDGSSRSASSSATPGAVVVNGQDLSPEKLQELRQTYGVEPMPGKYWYDTVSGMYGNAGAPPTGFMLPNHSFGQLSSDASNGHTGIIVNGRELPQLEVNSLMLLFGQPILQGHYWLDAMGNYGQEGALFAMGNLLVFAQARTGGGGDNVWSSRFGAGNSNAGNTQGYVSVPGHGPIGYGF